MKKLLIAFTFLFLVSFLSAQNFGLEFSGINESEVIIPQDATLTPSEAITVEAWVKLDALTNLPTIVSSEDWSAGETGYVLRIENFNLPNTPQFQIGTSSSWQTVSATSGDIPYDIWTHVAGTFDGAAVKIFINGVEAGSLDYSGTILPSSIDVKIGGHVDHQYNNRQWDGSIDEVRIWDVAKTAEELTANMNMGLTGTETNLLGYWMFDEGDGTTANDATVNGNDATILGCNWVDGAPINQEAGTVEGTITLSGEVDVTIVEVAVGTFITNPDATGFYTLDVPPADYTVTASAVGFYTVNTEIEVILDETTTANLELVAIPAPLNLVYDEVNEVLSWTEPVENLPIDSFNIYQNNALLATVDAAILSYEISAHGIYYITSVYEEDESLPSNSVDIIYYYSPTNLQVQILNEVNIRLIWNYPIDGGAELTDYKIYRNGEEIAMIDGDDFIYNDEELPNGTYTYYVTAIYTEVESEPTDTISADIESFSAPENLVVEVMNENDAYLSWEAPADMADAVTGYRIYRDGAELGDLNDDELAFIDNDLENDSYEYHVTALYDQAESVPSNTVIIEIAVDADENELSITPTLGNYPNPFNPTTTIQYNLGLNEQAELKIYNAKGQCIKRFDLVQNGKVGSIVWNGTDLAGNPVTSGVYLYRLENNGKIIATDKMMLLK